MSFGFRVHVDGAGEPAVEHSWGDVPSGTGYTISGHVAEDGYVSLGVALMDGEDKSVGGVSGYFYHRPPVVDDTPADAES